VRRASLEAENEKKITLMTSDILAQLDKTLVRMVYSDD